MAVVVAGLLVLAGSRTPQDGTSDDRLYGIAGQLKCLQCVGESVAASQAPLAEQFRTEIRQQMSAGSTDDEILAFFVDRYGDEVLLEPPASGFGALVWLLPVLLVLAAVAGLVMAFGRWRANQENEGAGVVGAAESSPVDVSQASDTGDEVGAREPEPADPAPWRGAAIAGGIAVFLLLAGWLVVWGSDDRGEGELTGGVPTGREGAAACQPLAMSDPEAAIECYDRVLESSPTDVEALTYRGWAHIRSGEQAAGVTDLEAAVAADPAYGDAHVFLAVVAADAGDFPGAALELERFWATEPSEVAVSVVQAEGLEARVFVGNMSPAARECWLAADSDDSGSGLDQAYLDALGTCLDAVLVADPTDSDARLWRARSYLGPESADGATARILLLGLLADEPDNADALALLVQLDILSGDLDAAEAGLETLAGLPRGPAAFLLGDEAALRAALERARLASVPNPEGG